MLDVMKTPPPVIEQITWTAERVQKPDDDETVLMYYPDHADDPVCEGWYDSANDQWLTIEGYPLGMVTWWAKKPVGPTEPKPGVVTAPSPLVAATMDHAVELVTDSDNMRKRLRGDHVQRIVRTLLKQLGLQALGGRILSIDLQNGYHLQVRVAQVSEVTG